MKLIEPKGINTQPFGVNYNNSYKDSGLKGHTGIDYVHGYTQTIKATVTGEVYSLLNMTNQDTNKYRAIFQLVDDTDFSYEVSYGHVFDSFVKEGQIVKAGKSIGLEGNYGLCFTNGVLVTPAQKLKGIGSHLHFQVRKLIRVKKRNSKKHYIRNSEGYVKRNGFYYEVMDYDNGYNGCIDPKQFYDDGEYKKTLLKQALGLAQQLLKLKQANSQT